MFGYIDYKGSFRLRHSLVIIVAIILTLAVIYFARVESEVRLSPYPFGANFAFTITEDPDSSSLDETKLVYDFLIEEGLRTTIAVWISEATRTNGIPDLHKTQNFGITCENPEYLEYVKHLKAKGFEIALHGVSGGNDLREKTLEGYEKFKLFFGEYPKINIMHAQNLENVYWGKKILSNRIAQYLIGLVTDRSNMPFSGEVPSSIYFWGDILQQKTKYVRLFGSKDINTLKFNPSMPYHDPEKPYVNYWFSFSDGFGVDGFNNLISKDNVDELVNDRGACIAYTHFAHGFVREGKLNENFQRRIGYLVSQPDGWFVTASELLDRLLLMKKVILIEGRDRFLVVNLNSFDLKGVTVLVPNGQVWYGFDGIKYDVNDEGEIILDTLGAGRTVVFFKNKLKEGQRFASKNSKYAVIDFDDAIYISPKNGEKLEGLPGQDISEQKLFNTAGQEVTASEDGKIPLSSWAGKKEIVLFKNKSALHQRKQQPGICENFSMIFQRGLIYLKHN